MYILTSFIFKNSRGYSDLDVAYRRWVSSLGAQAHREIFKIRIFTFCTYMNCFERKIKHIYVSTVLAVLVVIAL